MTGHDHTTDLDPLRTTLTPIPADQRRAYYDALLAGRAEAERLGCGLMDDRIFAAFHRALSATWAPLIAERAAAAERERIARAIEDSAAGHIGDEYHNAIDHAAAIARRAEND